MLVWLKMKCTCHITTLMNSSHSKLQQKEPSLKLAWENILDYQH